MYVCCNFKSTKKENMIPYSAQSKLHLKQARFIFIRDLSSGHPIYMRGCNSRRKIPGFKGHEVPVDFAAVHIGFNNLISEGMLKEDPPRFPGGVP